MIEKIVSGGQTGVDRAALDVALQLGISHGGWCPKGRVAEDGRVPLRYKLKETTSRNYPQRTEWNIRDSDGTLILVNGRLSRGTALTARVAEEMGRAFLVLDLKDSPSPSMVREWTKRHGIKSLNIAGPRRSKQPEIYGVTKKFLIRVFDGS